jgi:hypothetical protein
MEVHRTQFAFLVLRGSSILRLDLNLVFCARRDRYPTPVHLLAVDVHWEPTPLSLEEQIVLFALQGRTVTPMERIHPALVFRVKQERTALQAPLLALSVHPVTTAASRVLRLARHAPLELLQSDLQRQQPLLAQTVLWVTSAPLQALQYAARALPERSATNREPLLLGYLAL